MKFDDIFEFLEIGENFLYKPSNSIWKKISKNGGVLLRCEEHKKLEGQSIFSFAIHNWSLTKEDPKISLDKICRHIK